MISDFKKEKVPFTQVANEVLNCTTLSLKAKGMYAYLFSKPDGWDFSSNRMKSDHKDGRDGILAALKELEDNGVLVRIKHGDGRMEYLLKHAIQSRKSPTRVDDPKSEKPKVGKAHSGKSRPISNIDNTSNIDKESNKELGAPAKVKPKDFADKFFKDVLTLVNLPKGTKPPPELEWLTNMLHELHERNNNVPKAALWSEIKDFCAYWNEQNHMGTKRKWEMQKTFEIGRRLTTWFSRAKFKGFTASVDFNSKPKGSNMII